MANPANIIGQFTNEIEQTTKDVAGEVKDSFGEAIEQGIQAVVGPQLTPQSFDSAQDKQKKEQEDQRKLAEARRKIGFYQNVEQEQSQVTALNKQKEEQRLQTVQQEEQTKHVEKEQKKKESPLITEGRPEFKKGVGG